jgi:hypothetical protein
VRCWVRASAYRKVVWARAVEMSGSGVTLESILPFRTGSFVTLRSKSLNLLAGCAHVRHCTRSGWKFRIGLSFDTPVTARF